MDSEAKLDRRGIGYTAAFICDLSRYRSAMDGTPEERSISGKPTLHALDSALTASLISQLWFDHTFGPRVRIRRLRTYHQLSESFGHNFRIADIPNLTLENESLIISEDYLKQIESVCYDINPFGMACSFTCDTKDRICRILFTNESHYIAKCKIIFRRGKPVLADILSAFFNNQFNIIDFRVRYNATVGANGKPALPPRTLERFSSLDLVLQCSNPDLWKKERPLDDTFDFLEKKLGDAIVIDRSSTMFNNIMEARYEYE